jgi:hypothetical protein
MCNLLGVAGGPELVGNEKLIGLGELIVNQTVKFVFQMDGASADWPLLSHALALCSASFAMPV